MAGMESQVGFSVRAAAYGLAMSWGGLRLLAGYGIARCSRRLKFLGIALGCGAFASCLVITAGDYERMMGVLAPVILVAGARAIQAARRISRKGVRALLCCAPLLFLFGNPYIVRLEDPAYRLGLAVTTTSFAVVAATLVTRSCLARTTRAETTGLNAS